MEHKKKLHIPILIKLTIFTFVILLSVATFISINSTNEFTKISSKREQDTNRNQAKTRATEIEALLNNYIDKVKIVAGLLVKRSKEGQNVESSLDLSFNRDKDLVSVTIYEMKSGKPVKLDRVTNNSFLKQYSLTDDYIENLRQNKKFPIRSSFAGNFEIKNSSLKGGAPLVSVGVPLVKDQFGRIMTIALADIRLDKIQKSFSIISERQVYLIDKDGNLLAHPNEDWALKGYNMGGYPIVATALKSQSRVGDRSFVNPDDDQGYIGSYVKSQLGVTVISQASQEIILEPARNVRRKAFFITGVAISITLLFIYLVAHSLSDPIRKLLGLTKEIAQGNFDVSATKDIRTRDEVGDLAEAFDDMTEGLRERDKVKNLFTKFQGSEVLEEMMSKGDVELGGSSKEVAIFFSDIRSFTKFSESRTPQEVVDMLNEYFEIMVRIINKYNGMVNKFVGDAIMAIWGAPKPTGDDSYNALMACIEMRLALQELNDRRVARGEIPIMIGMGLHKGNTIAGNIGSSERMEYTVIGDAVNMAARIEASTKAFGTDLLISQNLANEVNGRFQLEKAGAAEVKGKSEALTMFKVRGYFKEGQFIDTTTQYSDYQAEGADKVKVVS